MPERKVPAPNYTQAPNEFFDRLLAEIDSLREMKVTLAIIRETFGWHRPDAELSLSDLARLTGMERSHVSLGIKKALERGYVYRKQKGQTFVYGINVEEETVTKSVTAPETGVTETVTASVTESVNELLPNRKQPYKDKETLKERKKENSPHTHGPALPAGARDATAVPKRVCVDGSSSPSQNPSTPRSPKSKFTLEDRKRYARNHPLNNPPGWLAASEDGRFDVLVADWLSMHGPPVEGVPPAAARDVSMCPDCHGSGMYYPNGFTGGGVVKCRHLKLGEKGSAAA